MFPKPASRSAGAGATPVSQSRPRSAWRPRPANCRSRLAGCRSDRRPLRRLHVAEAAGGLPAATGTAAERVLAGLDPEQRAAAEAVRGPVCILAGAGTGKTRAITHRIAYAVAVGAVPADAVLAVTFTARAAGELRTRLRGLGAGGVQARTFHAAALRQLSYFAPQVLGGPMPEVASNPIRWVSQAANRLRLRTDKAELRDLAGEIDWAKSSLIAPQDYLGAAAKARPRHLADAGTGGRGLCRLRGGQAAQQRDRLLRSAADHGRRAGGDPRSGAGDPHPVPLLRDRRVPGRLADPAAAARRLARRSRRRLRGG